MNPSSLTTNGYYLSKQIITQLVKEYNCQAFQVTVDGNEKLHNLTRKLKNGGGTYHIVMSNFKNLINYKKNNVLDFEIVLRINLLNSKIEDINDLLNEFTETNKNYFSIYFRTIYDTKSYCANNQSDEYSNQYNKLAQKLNFTLYINPNINLRFCEGNLGINYFEIAPDLSLWKCINYQSDANFKLGNINNQGKIVVNEDFLNKLFSINPFENKKCFNCQLLPLCYGGCPMAQINNINNGLCKKKNLDILDFMLQN